MSEALQIVEKDSGDLRVDSRIVAESLKIQHGNLMETIYKYQSRIVERFGAIRFETGTIETKELGEWVNPKPSKYALLTEDQALFVATLSRNTAAVVDFKGKLVLAFSEARKRLQGPVLPTDYLSALKALVASEEEKRALAAVNVEQAHQLKEAQPKVEGFETFLSADAAVSIDDLAKTLGYPPRKFKEHLKQIGVLMQNGKPYAPYANKHWFRIIQKNIGTADNPWYVQQVLVEPVGQEGIYQLLKKKPVFPGAMPSLFASR